MTFEEQIGTKLAVGFPGTEATDDLVAKGRAARKASRALSHMSATVKNRVLLNIAKALETKQTAVLEANQEDWKAAEADGLNEAMLDRLLLTSERLCAMAQDVRGVAALPDPVGESLDMTTLPNGLMVGKRRVPLGVIGSIY